MIEDIALIVIGKFIIGVAGSGIASVVIPKISNSQFI
jgi:hypothetical protein